MCLGIPMQVEQSMEHAAICLHNGKKHTIDTSLVGQQSAGTWLLVFLGDARQVLNEKEALEVSNALNAVSAVMAGDKNIDHLFADLVDREPVLPDHLKSS